MGKRNKKLPALSRFLDYCRPRISPIESVGVRPWVWLSIFTTFVAGYIVYAAASSGDGNRAGLAIVVAAVGSLVLIKSTYEIARFQFVGHVAPHAALRMVARLHHKKVDSTLHRTMHPLAAAMLEVASGYWLRIDSALESPFFADDPVPEHWKSVRARIRTEAEFSMLSLIRSTYGLLFGCSGVEDDLLADLQGQEFASLEELRAWLVRRAEKMSMKARLMQSIPSAATQLWELMRLTREIELLPLTSIEHPFLFEAPPSRIDDLLIQMSEVRQAEVEIQSARINGDAQS